MKNSVFSFQIQQFIDDFDFINLSIQELCRIIFYHLPFLLHQIKRLKGEEEKWNGTDDIFVKKKGNIEKEGGDSGFI